MENPMIRHEPPTGDEPCCGSCGKDSVELVSSGESYLCLKCASEMDLIFSPEDEVKVQEYLGGKGNL